MQSDFEHEQDFHDGDPRSIADLIRDLRDQSLDLLRQEVALARSELAEKALTLLRHAALLVVGAIAALLAAVFLLISLHQAIYAALVGGDVSPVMASWLAPLVLGTLLATAAIALIARGLATLRLTSITPRQSV